MIDPALFLAFVAATTVLMLIPCPNVALIVANSVAYGTRYGLLTVAATSCAMVPQLLLTGLGLTAVLGTLAGWFEWLRWAGVVYLLWLGVRQWRAAPTILGDVRAQPRSMRRIVLRGFLVSCTNPKTLLFYSAFFPQFIGGVGVHTPAWTQIALLSVTFLAIAVLVDSLWALAAGRARRVLALHGRLRNRLTGGLLIGAGLGLAAAHRTHAP